jgi:hypothetical protein
VTIELDLTEQGLRPMTLQGQDENGDDFEIRFVFKKRLTRQQSMTMTRTVGKGKKAREVPDLVRLYTHSIRSIHLILGFKLRYKGEPLPVDVPIEDTMTIVAIMDNISTTITDEVDHHVLGTTDLELEEKNS